MKFKFSTDLALDANGSQETSTLIYQATVKRMLCFSYTLPYDSCDMKRALRRGNH